MGKKARMAIMEEVRTSCSRSRVTKITRGRAEYLLRAFERHFHLLELGLAVQPVAIHRVDHIVLVGDRPFSAIFAGLIFRNRAGVSSAVLQSLGCSVKGSRTMHHSRAHTIDPD